MNLTRRIAAAMLAFALLGVSSASATPTISTGGIVMSSTGSGWLVPGNYWSIYGSNLSLCTTGSCSGSQYSYVTAQYYFQPNGGGGYWSSPVYYSQSLNNPGYWYESAGQINFYANPFQPANTNVYPAYNIWVTDGNGNTSSEYQYYTCINFNNNC